MKGRLGPGSRASAALVLALAAITLLGFGVRVWGIGDQPPIRDETLSAFTAVNYVEHGQFGPTMPFHPNLRNLILYASMNLWGTGVLGLRGPSLLLGTLTVPLLGFLVLRLTRNRFASSAAALFLALDPVHVTFSRQSIQEVHTTFFFLGGTALFALSLDERWRLKASAWLPLSGVAFGLALASKHHGLFPLAVCCGWALFSACRRRDWPLAAFVAACLLLLPLTTYLLTYRPWFERGYDLKEWVGMQVALAREIVGHRGYIDSSTVDTQPWQWFVKPLTGYGNFAYAQGQPFVTIAMGNPLVWLSVLPASVWLLVRRRNDPGVNLLQLLFWVAYLPLALSPRPIWVLSSLAVTPFAFGLHACSLVPFTRGPHLRWLVAFLIAVVVVSALLLPMSMGRAWEYAYLRPIVMRFAPHPG